jgi:hypothetical protein
MALTDGILAYWNLDNDGSGGLSLLDSTGNGYTLTNNGVVLGNGKIGNGGQWPTPHTDGDSRWMENDSLSVAGDFSISFWVYPSSFSDQPFYIPICLGSGSRVGFWINPDSSAYYLVGPSVGSVGFSVNFNSWNYITIVVDSTALLATYYINSNPTQSIDVSNSLFFPLDNVFLGCANDQAFPSGQFIFEGNLDEIGVWNRQLSQGEIISLYNNGSGLAYPFGISPSGGNNNIARLLNLPLAIESNNKISQLLNLPWFVNV